MVFLLSKVFRRLRLREGAVGLTVALGGMLVLWVAATVLIALFESSTLREAAWQVWQTVTTVGYGDGPPKSDGGRLVTIVYSVLGIVLFGKAISAYTEYREEVQNRRRFGLLRNQELEAYVLIHYPGASRLQTFVSQIRMVEPEAPICIVDSALEELPKQMQLDRDIHFVRGSLLARETYVQANVGSAKQIIVFPRADQGREADATSKTIVEIIEESFADSSPCIVCVLADDANAWMFEKTVAKLIQGDLEILALVQECQDAHTGAAVQELLSNESGANPVTVRPRLLVGKTWGHLCESLLALERSGQRAVRPFALVQNQRPVHCPGWDTVIQESDHLILISSERLDWNSFESRLAGP